MIMMGGFWCITVYGCMPACMHVMWAGVAVGSGWQSYVAFINLGCYYLIGVPLGFLMGWVFHLGVMVIFSFYIYLPYVYMYVRTYVNRVRARVNQGIWAGMIFGGTVTQTLILALITIRCDWDKEVLYMSNQIVTTPHQNSLASLFYSSLFLWFNITSLIYLNGNANAGWESIIACKEMGNSKAWSGLKEEWRMYY